VGSLTQAASANSCPTVFDRDHEAVDGATIDTRAGPATESVELLQPDVVLLLLGGNDLRRQPVDEVADELESFIGDMQAASPDVAVFVAQLPPCRTALTASEGIPALNEAIASFSRLSTEQSLVTVVDMNTDFSVEDLADSRHPNDAGDQEMARRWMAAMLDADVIAA
jgi:lysophospholipase L1-like esterase